MARGNWRVMASKKAGATSEKIGDRLRKKYPPSKEKMWGCFEKRAAGWYTTPWGVCLYRHGRPVLNILGGARGRGWCAVFIMRPALMAPLRYLSLSKNPNTVRTANNIAPQKQIHINNHLLLFFEIGKTNFAMI